MASKNNSHLFSQIPEANIPRSTFNRGFGYKTTFDSGYLVPFLVDEVLPGDTFKMKATIFSRMSTPIVPVMDNMYLETFLFFVPTRLVWSNWEKFNGAQDNPGDSTDYLIPTLANNEGFATQSIFDYAGIPTGVAITDNNPINALPFRAMNLIYNEWFRDENLQDSLTVETGDGPDPIANYNLFKRGKRHDYFTSALPFPQKGPAEGITINLGEQAPILGSIVSPAQTIEFKRASSIGGTNKNGLITNDPDDAPYNVYLNGGSNLSNYWKLTGTKPAQTLNVDLTADLSLATAISINDLRTAFQLQKLLERDARGGSRYTEILRSHFGVVSPDARLQRPEYLGGSSTRIIVKPVEQTSATDSTSPQGNLAAYAVGADSFHGFTKSFVEHGYIIGFMNVRADLSYQQGLDRLWSRRDRFDFYWPSLAHLGEQAVLNKEIFMQGTEADQQVFGYQERYAEYRYKNSLITGKFRSQDPQSLDIWHLAQDFESLPMLNSEFIQDNPPIKRALAVQNEPEFICDINVDMKCTRPMPVYSVPGFVDHF